MAASIGEVIRFKFILCACAITATLSGSYPSASAATSKPLCKKFNFSQLFYADYKTGTHWDNSKSEVAIGWSAQSSTINDEASARPFTDAELDWLRIAFNSWDDALDSLSFVEVDIAATPQITIGFVDLNPQTTQLNAFGFWNSWSIEGVRVRATIKLKSSKVDWFSRKQQFIHTAQHEIGNVLGLGDISPTASFTSVLEDPWQPPYGRSTLSSTDVAIAKQLYGERVGCTGKAKATSPEVRER
jgi:hypothetical protein